MKLFFTASLLAASSIRLRFTLAFPFSSYSRDRRTLNTLLPVNVTSVFTTQNTVIPSTNLTSTNVTFTPWPRLPFDLYLPSENYTLHVMYVSPWISWERIDLIDLMDFISIFGVNLEEEYPPPALAPRRAGSRCIDGKTLTRWKIEFVRSALGRAVPTEVLLECLDQLNLLIRRHGPASISSFIYWDTSRFIWSASLSMTIKNVAGETLNSSSPSQEYGFETS